MRNKLLFGSVLLIISLFLSGCSEVQEENENIYLIAKLLSIRGGDFVESAGYYEGELILEEVYSKELHTVFLCIEDWSNIQKNSCYLINPFEIAENVESHMYSMELSGCYVGDLRRVSC